MKRSPIVRWKADCSFDLRQKPPAFADALRFLPQAHAPNSPLAKSGNAAGSGTGFSWVEDIAGFGIVAPTAFIIATWQDRQHDVDAAGARAAADKVARKCDKPSRDNGR
jgi:hypothetical protein